MEKLTHCEFHKLDPVLSEKESDLSSSFSTSLLQKQHADLSQAPAAVVHLNCEPK